MINKRLLFNTYKFAEDAKFVSALATGFDSSYLDIGKPCIIDKNSFSTFTKDDFMWALFPFGSSIGKKPNFIAGVKRKNIVITGNDCIVNNNIKTIDAFDFDKLKKLTECVNDKGSVMFALSTPYPSGVAKATGKNAILFINEMYNNIIAKYTYHSTSFISYNKDAAPLLGDLRYIIHFISIPNCVPILNHHKIDGIGMVFSIVSLANTLKKRHMETVFCLSIILSNYMENVFVIDGVNIANQIAIKSEYLIDAKHIINRSMKQPVKGCVWQKKKEQNKKKQEEKKLDTPDKSGWIKTTLGDHGCNYSGTGDSSSTSSLSTTGQYYYT